MSKTNRRTFIVAAGGTAAAAAVAPTVLATAAQAVPDETSSSPSRTGERLVAYVDNQRSGHLTLMWGEDEVRVHDPDLVQRLTRAARG